MKNKKLYLFDIDGTLILGNKPINGAEDIISEIRRKGKKFMLFTNNSSRTRLEYVEKFKKMNIKIFEEEIVTAGYMLGEYLIEKKTNPSVYLVGTKSLKKLLENMGVKIVEEPQKINGKYDVDYVAVALDSELNYQKITTACELLSEGVEYVAANPDFVYPVEGGKFLPDCGSICKMLEYAVKRKPLFLGKPSREILDYCIKKNGVSKEETVIIGDRLYTDIACGYDNGCDTILVLTGESKREDIKDSPYKPDFILESIKDIKI